MENKQGSRKKSRRKNKTILRPTRCIDIHVLISHFITLYFELKINTLGFYGEKIIGCVKERCRKSCIPFNRIFYILFAFSHPERTYIIL